MLRLFVLSIVTAETIWKHVPAMLAQNIHATSQIVSIHTKSKVVSGSKPIDLFDFANTCSNEETCSSPHPLAYGNVLYHIETCSSDAANSALNEVVTKLGLNPNQVKLIDANVLQLDITKDSIHQLEVVAYNYMSDSPKIRLKVNQGMNFHLTFTTPGKTHRAVVQLNTLEHSYSLLQHTYQFDEPSSLTSLSPKIATYNVWNVNPPSIVYGAQNRWAMYSKRMDHLAHFLNEVDADIVGLQEVRVDDTFGPVGQHAQIQHIRERLKNDYQFVYRAAMSYLNDHNPLERIEEGPVILSKFPILSSDYILLSRVVDDPNDSHQRLCLHASVQVPKWGVIDVYVTHLSLSERSREQTMVEILNYMKQGKGVTQVLLGDLNAEPQSLGIQFLQGKAMLKETQSDLKDAWLELHSEPIPESKHAEDIHNKFTFPCDDPVKRIDFILYRGQGQVKDCSVFGQAPTPDTLHHPKNNGMLSQDGDSPIYASDHRGVVATFVV